MDHSAEIESDGDSRVSGAPQNGLHERRPNRRPQGAADELSPISTSEDNASTLKLRWKDRVRHFTWAWFVMTMATGGITNVLYHIKPRFPGLYVIGVIFLFIHIVEFIFNCIMISLRFYFYPSTFRASLTHPTESLFVAAGVVSISTILINITQYGLDIGRTGAWLLQVMTVLYWIYIALAVIFSSGIFLLMWSTQVFTISQMTPIWIFPAYPLLLVGPFAGDLSMHASGNTAVAMLVGGVILQGIGFMVSLMVYSAYLYRLMTQKLPEDSARPAMFISVGPSGFTISGLINMAHNFPHVVPATFMGVDGQLAGQVTQILAYWAGLWLWGLAIWFFIISVGAHWTAVRRGKMQFTMAWWSFIFPNTALTTATFAVAKALDDNRVIQYLGCVMAAIVVFVWLIVNFLMVRAILRKKILWPQMQEDKDYDKDEDVWRRSPTLGRKFRTSDHLPTLRTFIGRKSSPASGAAASGSKSRDLEAVAEHEKGGNSNSGINMR